MNEADVREDVLAPLIAALGYRTGTEFDIVREQSLRYPKSFLGRKNPNRDPELRGKADYILDVENHARWVLEAKSPDSEIGIDAIEQAWTYANHPEIRAVYFVVSNGRELRVYVTSGSPSADPILVVAQEEIAVRFGELVNLLGPTAIIRDFPDRRLPTQAPLGPGLREFARVLNGTITHRASNAPQPFLSQMQVAIVDGAIERIEDGRLLAFMKTQSPLRTMQELNEAMGLDVFEMVSESSVLSLDPENPTRFTYEHAVTFPKGTELLDTATWQAMSLAMDFHGEVAAQAIGYLSENVFSGRFISAVQFVNVGTPVVTVEGDFHIRLA